MTTDMEICFSFLLNYIKGNHMNHIEFNGDLTMLGSIEDSNLQALHCVYRIGQELGLDTEQLNALLKDSMDLTLGRG